MDIELQRELDIWENLTLMLQTEEVFIALMKKVLVICIMAIVACCSCTQENQTDAVFEDAQSEYATSNGSLCKEEPSIMQPQIIGCYIMMRQQKLPVYYVDERTVVMMI